MAAAIAKEASCSCPPLRPPEGGLMVRATVAIGCTAVEDDVRANTSYPNARILQSARAFTSGFCRVSKQPLLGGRHHNE